MLQGVLVYRDETLGDVFFNVKARDSFNDLRMRLAAVDTPFEEYNKACKCFDNVKTEEGTIVNEYYDLQGFVDSRRLDIKKNNKYKGNIQNRDMCARISAFIRYLQMSGKKNYGAAKASDFSTIREVEVFNGDTKLGTIKYNSGLIIGLDCENKYVRMHLDSVPDDTIEDAIFKELKEKDKYGKKVSFTPVENVGFKLCTETLGFEYVSQVQKEYANVLGMFETIEEVIANNPDKNTDWILQRDYQIVTDEILDDLFNDFMAHDGFIAFDTETTGLDITFKSRSGEGSELVGVVLSKKVGTGYYFPLQHKLFKNLCNGDHWFFMEKYMRPILEDKRIICHNVSYDWKVAHIYDINVNCVYDTMIAFGVTKRYEEETFEMGLKALAHNILGLDMFDLSDFVMGGSFGDSDVTFADLPYELVRRYAPADADMTLSLYEYLEHEDILNKYEAKRIFDMEIWFAKAVAYSEFYGYHIDTDRIPKLSEEIEGAMEKHKKNMFDMAGEEFNANSSQQLIRIMYEKLGIETVGAKPSTNKEVLKTLSLMQDEEGNPKYPFVQELKSYRDNESIYKNFLKKLHLFATSDGYIFPEVLQFGTTTGRVSVKNPNYQSYNDIVKHYVVPRPGFYHFDSDFAQIEQRVLVSYSSILFDDYESLALLKDFNDPDMDYHQYQAARMFNVPYAAVTKSMRQQSKGINFGLPYGMGDESLGARIFGARNDVNTRKAKDLRRKFFQGQELIEKFFETVRSNGVRDGYTSTQFGRRRYYHRGTFTVAEIRRQAGNHVIQGCLGGDTRILTKEYGIVKIKDVAGLSLHVWDGSKWSKGDITYSGKKKKCVVSFSGGQSIICSPIHKFLVSSSKGNKRFVECQDLKTSENSSSPSRVMFNRNYEPANNCYSSKAAYKYGGTAHNSKNVFLEDIGNSFDIGLMLGRLASDGSISYRENGGSYIQHFIAEHEFDILPKLKGIMSSLGVVERNNELRDGRFEKINHLNVYSSSLVKEINDLDIKHSIHDNIFMDTELLRGFLSGMFDGDGGVSGKAIQLVFGTQYNFEPMCLDIQKALLFFGVRSRFRKYDDRFVIQIKTNDTSRFLDLIGFINRNKQEKGRQLVCNTDEHVFGPALIVKSVEITDDYIDMYDVCNTDGGYYVADGIITHNTAADIYKMAVVNMFQRICKEGWLGKVLFNGFIHDEILMEVHESINPYYFFKVWRSEFEVKPENYCRLFAGAGVGKCWYDAKKLDLPPEYIEDIIQTYEEDMPWDENFDNFLQDVKDGFVRFKTNKVKKYLLDESNHGAIIKPAISALLPDEVEAIMDKVCNDQNLIVEYGNDLGVAIEFGKPFKTKDLQMQLKIFCKATGIDYNSIDIKSLEDADIKQNNMSDEDDETLEYDNTANIELFKQNIQRAGVYRDFATGQVVLGDVYLPNGVSVLNLCMKQGWIKTDNSGELKVAYVSNVNAENFEIHQTTCTMTHSDYNSLRAFYVNAIKMGGVVK